MSKTPVTAEDLYNINTVTDPRFTPDGQWLAYVQTRAQRDIDDYRSAIWLAPVSGGRARQFTAGERRDTAPRWSPDGRWLAFVSTRGGEKVRAQIYVMARDGGEAQRLIEMENGAGEPAWSPDGRQLAFTARLAADDLAIEAEERPADPEQARQRAEAKEKREKKKTDPRVITRFAYRTETSYLDGRTNHLYVVDVHPETGQAVGKPRRLTEDERDYADPRWLPDGSGLVAVARREPGLDDLFHYPDIVRVPLAGGGVQVLTGPDTEDQAPRPSPDGQWIAYLSQPVDDLAGSNLEIKLLPATGGSPRLLTGALDAHARDVSWSPDSQSVLFLVPRHGRDDLCRVGLDGGPVTTLLSAEREILSYDLDRAGQQAGLVANTDRAPWDLYVAALDGSGERRLTEVNASWLAERSLAEVEDVWFESGDGQRIQGWIVKPPDREPSSGQKPPLALSIHGGPHVMWSRHEPTMWHEWQMLAARGYVVFACNPRGSDGYGRDFRAALLHHWGEADLPDLLAGVEHLVARGDVDPERLVVTGGSYGGFMTTWVISHDQRFKAAVAQRGVYDLISFYSTSDIPLLTEWEFGANPWQHSELMWRFSPLAHVENIHTPLLLLHSENDFRAPIPSAEGLFVALRHLKREVQMVRYPRDGHELSRSGEPQHRIDRLERIAGWFDRYVQTGHDQESRFADRQ